MSKNLKMCDGIPDAHGMRAIGDLLKELVPDAAFALFMYEKGADGKMSNYIANIERGNMIEVLEEKLQHFKAGRDFQTPEGN